MGRARLRTAVDGLHVPQGDAAEGHVSTYASPVARYGDERMSARERAAAVRCVEEIEALRASCLRLQAQARQPQKLVYGPMAQSSLAECTRRRHRQLQEAAAGDLSPLHELWEVDDECEGAVSFRAFKTMWDRSRNDLTGCEPRKFFNMIEFVMYDKNMSGSIDLDECMSLLYQRFSKAEVDGVVAELGRDESAGEKSVSFSRFVNIQYAATKKRKQAGFAF